MFFPFLPCNDSPAASRISSIASSPLSSYKYAPVSSISIFSAS
jgi:hypothetical protein